MRLPLAFITTGALPLLGAVGGAARIRFDPAGPSAAMAVVGRAMARRSVCCCLPRRRRWRPAARLHRLGVPAAVSEVASLTYRLLFLLLSTARSVREAQAARMGFSSWSRRCAGGGPGRRGLVPALDRARRLEEGLAGRGYTGSLRVAVEARRVPIPFVVALAVVAAGVLATLVVALAM